MPFYQPVYLPLWNGSPTYQDVFQGTTGDCWLMAGLAEVAARNPGDIQSMFIDNGDQTYTVRLYNNGTPDYVTVDNFLPVNGMNAGAKSDLWVPLAEKAYAQENGDGWLGSSMPGVATYQALWAGEPDWALKAITGLPAEYTSGYSGGVWYGAVLPSLSATDIANAWSEGQFVTLCTANPPSSLVVPDHCYAVVGYSNGWFTLFNPWGINGNYSRGVYYPGMIQVDATGLADNFDACATGDAAPGLAAPPANSLAGFKQAEVKPAMVWQDQIQTNLQDITSGTSATHSESPVDRALLELLAATKNHRIVGLETTAAVPGSDVNGLDAQVHDLVTL
jgi:hypothetical protein